MKNYIGEVVDLTGDSYLNPVGAFYGDGSGTHQRGEDIISSISVHHDASPRPHDYDSAARYRQEAVGHYNRLGPGLQYHYKIDNTGAIFKIRPHTTWLYVVGSADNVTCLAICLDGSFEAGAEQPTREQYEALKQLLDWLSTQNPQFAASQGDVYPHRHYSATNCCGDSLVPFVDGYRNSGGDIAIPDVSYDWPEFQMGAEAAPVTPPAVPAPPVAAPVVQQPAPVTQPTQPTLVVNYRVFGPDGKQVGAYNKDTNAWIKYQTTSNAVVRDQNGNDVTAQLRARFSPPPKNPHTDHSKIVQMDDRLKIVEKLLQNVTDFLDSIFKWRKK